MGVYYLAVLVVQEVCLVAVEHAYGAAVDRSGVPAGPYAFAARLDARHLDFPVIEEGVEEAHGVRAAPQPPHQTTPPPPPPPPPSFFFAGKGGGGGKARGAAAPPPPPKRGAPGPLRGPLVACV